jgi:AcrR family transcriptional regulator
LVDCFGDILQFDESSPPSGENLMSFHSAEPTGQKAEILVHAARAFARHGYAGTHLRSIALEAGVSHTLFDHHFGSKHDLLDAVIADHHDDCRRRRVRLHELVLDDGDIVPLPSLVEEWVRFEFNLYTTDKGRWYLQLMLQLANDEEVEVTVQRKLDCSEAIVRKGFKRVAPLVVDAKLDDAWVLASSALHAAITSLAPRQDEGSLRTVDQSIVETTQFLLGGLSRQLGIPIDQG